jgi:3-phenylpropionate/cinnamic acid dioxygenase small subunit
MDAAIERELLDFVAHEARLLDAERLDDWLALFTEDGRYWVPLQGLKRVDLLNPGAALPAIQLFP